MSLCLSLLREKCPDLASVIDAWPCLPEHKLATVVDAWSELPEDAIHLDTITISLSPGAEEKARQQQDATKPNKHPKIEGEE